ncbi:urease accessory protein UreD [Thioalkalivibrio sp.]|uniref:urease accessory protein UreD n=1 Tax=Thioalkalivibrio sp. TaxID=2093813 RepID=UPI003976005A
MSSLPFFRSEAGPPIPSLPEQQPAGQGWYARLELGFEAGPDCTVLRHRRHAGPLRVQRPFHPEGVPCHTYLLHPPGGVVGGDRLDLEVGVAGGGHALLTTPAAAKFYRSAGPLAHQRQSFRVAAGGTLEWLPALNILHGGARVALRNRFELAPDARLLAWDLLGLGRPGSGDGFESGHCDSSLQVRIGGRALLAERLRTDGGDPMLKAAWGLQGRGYLATLLAAPATPETLVALRSRLRQVPGAVFGCTLLPVPGPGPQGQTLTGLLVCRWLAAAGEALWESMVEAWALLRPLVLGREPCLPRIWST